MNRQAKQTFTPAPPDDGNSDSPLKEIKWIEGGVPPKKEDTATLPKPIRYFLYFILGTQIIIIIFGMISSFIHGSQ